jgi:hypothetical protein
MDAILGAWGIGAIAASMSKKHYVNRFSYDVLMGLCIPPMSSHHAGLVDLFPFLIFDHIYIDEQSYKGLVEDDIFIFQLSQLGKEILKEFLRQKILIKIDYTEIVEEFSDEIVEKSETQLESVDLRNQLKSSRTLWVKFLESAGGKLHAFRTQELDNTYKAIGQIDFLTEQNAVAERIAHDVYDVNSMLSLSKKLNIAICDWQMYAPLYEHQMLSSYPWMKKISSNNPEAVRNSLDVYIPIPKSPTIDSIFELRQESTILAFQNYTNFLENSHQNYTPLEYVELRKQLLNLGAGDVSRIGIFPNTSAPPALSENLIRKIIREEISTTLGSHNTSQNVIHIFQEIKSQYINTGDTHNFNNISSQNGGNIQIGIASKLSSNVSYQNPNIDTQGIEKIIEQLVDLIGKEIQDDTHRKYALENAEKAKNEARKPEINIEILARHLKAIATIAGSATAIGKLVETLIAMIR